MFCLSYFCWNQTFKNIVNLSIRDLGILCASLEGGRRLIFAEHYVPAGYGAPPANHCQPSDNP